VKHDVTAVATAADAEIAALITTLVDAGEKLQSLTHGEVDTVAGPEGRAYLLHDAQTFLREREVAKNVAILNSLPANIALLDSDGVIVAVNEAWLGFARANELQAPGAALGQNYLDICDRAERLVNAADIDGAGAPTAAQAIRSVLSGAQSLATLEYPCHSPGEQRWFLMSVTAVGDQTPRGAVVMHLDISQRRRAEQALASLSLDTERRERILSATFASMSDFAYIFDREARFLFANQPLLDTWGLALDEVLGRTCRDIGYPEELADRLERQARQVYADGVAITDETEFRTRDGRLGSYEYILSPVLAPDGRVEFVVGNTRDITERTAAEAALRLSVEQARDATALLSVQRARLLEAQRVAKIGSWETDLATMAVIWSEETHRIFETDAPIRHDTFLQRVHPQDRLRIDREFLDSLRSTDPQVSEHRVLLPDNRIKHVEVRWQVQFNAAGLAERVVGTSQDITERKLAELRIQRLNRVYVVLSQINALIVRVQSRDELFEQACRIAVEAGQFPLAWIGAVDAAAQRVVPVASVGADEEFLAQLAERLSFADDAPLGHGATAMAVRSGHYVVVNDVSNHPDLRHARVYLDRGIRAVASLPLIVGGEVVAVLGLHAGDVDYFDEAELALLLEMAKDIAFAMDHIGKAEQLNYVAYYDALTGLANRSLFVERARQCLRSAGVAGHGVAMVLFDLERFKGFNDSLGQGAGDELLRQVGAWLVANLADSSLLARVGADVFAMLLVDAPQPGDATRQLDRLVHAFHEQAFPVHGGVYRTAGKFGVAMYPDDASDPEALFLRTESALKNAKAGGHRQLFYTQKMTEAVARRLSLENQLRHALDNEEFVLHYQPKVDLRSGRVCGAEALIRWNDPLTGLVPPFQFIPILEETGLIHAVGRWALRQSLALYVRWRDAGFEAPRIAVNVSALQLRNPAFVCELAGLLAVHPRAAEGLELEITESMIMTDITQSIASLKAMREMGVRVAIDDFGTGFSSLGYLSKLPVDCLKIDRSFVNDMTGSPEGLSLVSTIITLAHSLHLRVVAEGVETEEQRGLLKLLRCDEMQGYLYSKPVPQADFEARFLTAP
jgi:diguanylate cyclase (GGDEF)-like protein/PAS domain S-box-containing protein